MNKESNSLLEHWKILKIFFMHNTLPFIKVKKPDDKEYKESKEYIIELEIK